MHFAVRHAFETLFRDEHYAPSRYRDCRGRARARARARQIRDIIGDLALASLAFATRASPGRRLGGRGGLRSAVPPFVTVVSRYTVINNSYGPSNPVAAGKLDSHPSRKRQIGSWSCNRVTGFPCTSSPRYMERILQEENAKGDRLRSRLTAERRLRSIREIAGNGDPRIPPPKKVIIGN